MLEGTWATASQLTSPTSPPPPPNPYTQRLSSGLQLGNPRPTRLGPQGVRVVDRGVVTEVTYSGRQIQSPGMYFAEASSMVSM